MAGNPRIQVNIAKLRKERTSFTQEEFAQKLGRSVDTISNYERGKTGTDVIQLIVEMCKLLRCRVDELLDYIDDESSESSDISDEPLAESPYDALRQWWHRVIDQAGELGGKQIEAVIDLLKGRDQYIDICKVFAPEPDLDERFTDIVREYEFSQQRQFDELDKDEKGDFKWDILRNDPERCAHIYCYLKTKDEKFLVTLNNSLKRLVKKTLVSS
jgi:transcriptional regulator with XRE-family HTH domain